jgi:hypothetical protein
MSSKDTRDELELQQLEAEIESAEESPEIETIPLPYRLPIWPIKLEASGLYQYALTIKQPVGAAEEVGEPGIDEGASGLSLPLRLSREQVCLDVDGRYPQMQASGTLNINLRNQIHWIAKLYATGTNSWTGRIWYKDGATTAFPYTYVKINVKRSWYPNQRYVSVTFGGGGAPLRTRSYRFRSRYFHAVEFEFDRVSDVPAASKVTQIQTCAHPNRPAGLACENLTIENVFQRSGFNVTKSGADNVVPVADAGANTTWSDMEMHDAMQVYWSRFANLPQWSLWTLFARQHDMGNGLGGIMFDDIGPNHRQGTSLFVDSFISQAPGGDPNPAAWVQRMRFWTAVHEMGHSFNLAHSWQKSLGTPWIPLANEPEARSFMNYPYNVSGGQSAFFADFEFRFSNGELLFMRHAPKRFVQMGNADWFDHHGFQQPELAAAPELQLQLRVNRPQAIFEFLEPVVLELKLTNVSTMPKLLDRNLLLASEEMTVIIKKDGKPARQWSPYARYCQNKAPVALDQGKSLYESLFISAGTNGWDIAEPGNYTVQMALEVAGEEIISNPIRLRVLPAQTFDAEYCAQEIFSEDVGRILAFDGSGVLDSGNQALEELVARLPKSQAAAHARVALALPKARNRKTLIITEGSPSLEAALNEKKARIAVSEPKIDEARKVMDTALVTNASNVAQALGHVDYKRYMDTYAGFLREQGDDKGAQQCRDKCQSILMARNVPDWVFLETGQPVAAMVAKRGKKKPAPA